MCWQRVVSRYICSARAGSSRVCHSAWLARAGGCAFGGEVEDGPQFHEPVEAVAGRAGAGPSRGRGRRRGGRSRGGRSARPRRAGGRGLPRVRSRRASTTGRRDRLVLLAVGVAACACRDGGEPGGEGGDLLVEAVEGVEQGCLPGGNVVTGADSVARLGQRAGQVGQAARGFAEVGGFALVEEGEAFGVLGDLQHDPGDQVTGVRCRVCLLPRVAGPGHPISTARRDDVGLRCRPRATARAGAARRGAGQLARRR